MRLKVQVDVEDQAFIILLKRGHKVQGLGFHVSFSSKLFHPFEVVGAS